MRAYFTICAMVSVLLLLSACDKKYQSFTCTCKLENTDGSVEMQEYGVQADIFINADADCQDIEDRLRVDNAAEDFEQEVHCDID